MRADMPELPSSSWPPGRTASIIDFFLGIWVLISPFVLPFARFPEAVWNNIIVGIVIMIVAGTRAWDARNRIVGLSWINFILGIWLIVSAFIFGFRMNPAVTWNQIISGIAVATISALSAMSRPSSPEPPPAV